MEMKPPLVPPTYLRTSRQAWIRSLFIIYLLVKRTSCCKYSLAADAHFYFYSYLYPFHGIPAVSFRSIYYLAGPGLATVPVDFYILSLNTSCE